MRIAYILFNGITWLDFVGFYDPVSRLRSMNFLPDLEWDLCSFTENVKDSFGLEVKPEHVRNSLAGYDAIYVPGGLGTRQLQFQEDFIDWIKTAQDAKTKISVCTGSLILGAAGFLKERKATTHFGEFENLKQYCREVIEERIVEDGDVITAGAVSASIDLGLYICEKWAGKEAAKEIRSRMAYSG